MPETLKWNGNEIVDEKGISVAGIVSQQPEEFAEEICKRWNAYQNPSRDSDNG